MHVITVTSMRCTYVALLQLLQDQFYEGAFIHTHQIFVPLISLAVCSLIVTVHAIITSDFGDCLDFR